jgi:hypothetical protein
VVFTDAFKAAVAQQMGKLNHAGLPEFLSQPLVTVNIRLATIRPPVSAT